MKHDRFFNFWLWLRYDSGLDGEREAESYAPCDHLGPIDTLGWTQIRGNVTYSFTDEMHSRWGIRLPFGHGLTLISASSDSRLVLEGPTPELLRRARLTIHRERNVIRDLRIMLPFVWQSEDKLRALKSCWKTIRKIHR